MADIENMTRTKGVGGFFFFRDTQKYIERIFIRLCLGEEKEEKVSPRVSE